MSEKWRTFKVGPEDFNTLEEYEKYMEHTRCSLCHQKLEVGDEFDLRSIQTAEEAGSLTVRAVIVHRKCLEDD